MDLSDERQQRQAVRHGLADAIAGVRRLQIVDDVYDEGYWADYRAGLAAWREAEPGERRKLETVPARPPTRHQAGQGHPDAGQADAGWHVDGHGVYVRANAPTADTEPQAPFAARMLSQLAAAGEWEPPDWPTVTHDRHSEAMGQLDRRWNEPSFGLDHDGPEAG